MRIALLMGNRFNPWHLKPFALLKESPEIVCFRAESEIQQYFDERDDGSVRFATERIYFDTQAKNPFIRTWNNLCCRYGGRLPQIMPFAERLYGFDVLQTWELFTDWTEQALEARRRFGNRVVVMVWDNIPFNMEHTERLRRIKASSIRDADAFIVYTERSRLMLALEGVSEDKIVKVNPGVDLDLFRPGTGDRSAFGIPDEAIVFLFVGWFLPRKGIDFLLCALHLLREKRAFGGRPLRLLIVGSGPGKDRVQAIVDRLCLGDSCIFVGSRPYNAMPAIYRAADIFVFPSVPTSQWQEQFGMAMLEAMACGLPIVASSSGAIPEIAGDSAVLCQPADVLSLYDILNRLVPDMEWRDRLGRSARYRAERYFDMRHAAASLSEIYARLIG